MRAQITGIAVSADAPQARAINEMIPFRRFFMPCCETHLCWTQLKYPVHCPYCGQHVYLQLKSEDHTEAADNNAWIRYGEIAPTL